MLGASTASGAPSGGAGPDACAARANGDPASHVLLQDDVFLPFQPKPSPTAATAVKMLLCRTRAAGYPLRVAVIASGGDLGDVPDYFEGHPVEVRKLAGGSGGGSALVPAVVLVGLLMRGGALAGWMRRSASSVLDSSERE